MRPLIRLSPALLALSASLGAGEQLRVLGLEDLALVVELSEPRVSPNGAAVAVLVSRPNYEANRSDTELTIVDVGGGGATVLSRRPGLRSPRWSPDGKRLAFLADGTPQIYVLPRDGGEAASVTSAKAGVRAFSWHPDGRAIAFLTADEAAAPVEPHNDAFEVGADDFLTTAAPRPVHAWLVSVPDDLAGALPAPRRLTSGDWSLATSLATSTLSWSPDGRLLALTRFATPHSGDSHRRSAWVLDVETGQFRVLTAGTLLETVVGFSPDGGCLALRRPRDSDPAALEELLVVPAAGGEARSMTRSLDRAPNLAAWLPDGALLVGGPDGTRTSLWRVGPDGAARKLDLGRVVSVSEVSVGAGGSVVLVGSEPDRPAELYELPSLASPPRRITDHHRELASRRLGRQEPIEWSGPDKLRADGVLTYPPEFDPSRKHPLVILIHGGPTSSDTLGFDFLAQLLAARGFLVLQPNYRGSDNRGHTFQRAIAAGAAEGPGRDVMEGLEAVERRGFVDERRIGVSGWSYGGFLTVWLTSRYPVFRAAVAGASALDLTDMYALSDLNVIPRHALLGSPWTGGREELYRRQSPLTYASRIRAPTLILAKTGDTRVAVTQSYKLFRALRDNGVTTQFIAYPGPGHFPRDPVRTRDVYRRWRAWLEEHLQARPR